MRFKAVRGFINDGVLSSFVVVSIRMDLLTPKQTILCTVRAECYTGAASTYGARGRAIKVTTVAGGFVVEGGPDGLRDGPDRHTST